MDLTIGTSVNKKLPINEKSTTDIEDMIFEASKQIEFLLQKKNQEENYNYFKKIKFMISKKINQMEKNFLISSSKVKILL